MRIFIGHRLAGGFWGGASMGRGFGRRKGSYYRDGGCGGCLTVLAVLAIIGLAIDYWPVTLGIVAITVLAAVIHRRRPGRLKRSSPSRERGDAGA